MGVGPGVALNPGVALDPARARAAADVGLNPRHGPKPWQGKGFAAAAVRDMMIKMRREAAPDALAGVRRGAVDRVLLLDREVDVVTPMVTQVC